MQHQVFTFVVLEKDIFVSLDMCAGLSEASPGSGTLHFRDSVPPSDLLDRLSDQHALPVLITKASIAQIEQTGIGSQWDLRGWPLVLRVDVDTPEQICARGWYPLEAPFTRPDLQNLVRRLTLRSAEGRRA